MASSIFPSVAHFRIVLSQRSELVPQPKQRRERERTLWSFKTFGFFDIMQIERVAQVQGGRFHDIGGQHQRTLYAFGEPARVERMLERVRKGQCYLGMALVKLAGDSAHVGFSRFLADRLKESDESTIYLGCLDAPDLLLLSVFPRKKSGAAKRPMHDLIDWMEEIREWEPFSGGVIERKLTMVACVNPQGFFDRLSQIEGRRSGAKALLRMTDGQNGSALPKLWTLLKKKPTTRRVQRKLLASAGYYDVQGLVTMKEAGLVLKAAWKEIEKGAISTSTCFLGKHDHHTADNATGSNESDLFKPLERDFDRLIKALARLEKIHCLHRNLQESADEIFDMFRQLDGTGFIPGSRLLIWTCLDAVVCLQKECRDFLREYPRLAEEDRQAHRDHFRDRQLAYSDFFRAVRSELDRRVSLSLPAYTRFIPCAIEAPLKIVGSLDVASRLISASFLAYECRTHTRLLQVFSTAPGKPTFFRKQPRPGAHTDNTPFPTMVTTTLSPAMLRHFYSALFSVFHEVAQCIIGDTFDHPTFSSLVYTHGQVERLAALTALVEKNDQPFRMKSLPGHFRQKTYKILGEDAGNCAWARRNTRISRAYFATNPEVFSEIRKPAVGPWEQEKVFQSQSGLWRVARITVSPDNLESIRRCQQMYRDAIAASWFQVKLGTDRFQREFVSRIREEFRHVKPNKAQSRRLELEAARNAESPLFHPSSKLDRDRWVTRLWKDWEAGFNESEYMELASLVPFLRLFQKDDSIAQAQTAVTGLIDDFSGIWLDWIDESMCRYAARRFVVAIAALEIYQRQNRLFKDDPKAAETANAIGPKADEEIQRTVSSCAQRLLRHHNRRCKRPDDFDKIWTMLAQTEDETPQSVPGIGCFSETCSIEVICQPVFVNAMVRFMVRLLHVFRVDSPFVRPKYSGELEVINVYLRDIFVGRNDQRDCCLPVTEIARLWELQYRLTAKDADLSIAHGISHTCKTILAAPNTDGGPAAVPLKSRSPGSN